MFLVLGFWVLGNLDNVYVKTLGWSMLATASADEAAPRKLHPKHGEPCKNFAVCGKHLILGRIHAGQY